MWDNGLVPETLTVECFTAYVPGRNVPSAVRGQAVPATGDPLRLCFMPSGYSRRAASAISHPRAAAILLIPGSLTLRPQSVVRMA